MKRLYIYSFALVLLFSAQSVVAQDVTARISGLERDDNYMQLLRQEAALKMRTDSVVSLFADVRRDMRSNSNVELTDIERDSLSGVISNVEAALLQLRQEKLLLVDKINAIEQKYVLSRMDNVNSSITSSGASSSIFNNEYFRKSLPAEDYQALLRVHAMESDVRNKARQYSANYVEIKNLYNNYLMASEEAEAGALYEDLTEAMADNYDLEEQISASWGEIFDQKSYVYSYFFEKENRMDILEITEGMMLDARLKKMQEVDECMSEPMVDYYLQKRVILDYETYVAKLLNLQKSIDSLSADARIHRELDYHLPPFDVERRSFVTYEPIKFNAKSPYNSSNPVPECVMYEYGTIYRLLLGKYKYKQNLSIFKNISPLYIYTGEDGQYSYYAGGFRTKSEASAAAGILKKKGFRNPQIIEWCNGDMVNISSLGEEGDLFYRIEISGGELNDKTLDIIKEMAGDGQVSKIGEGKYVIGVFDSRAVTNQVAAAIEDSEDSLSVKVEVVE